MENKLFLQHIDFVISESYYLLQNDSVLQQPLPKGSALPITTERILFMKVFISEHSNAAIYEQIEQQIKDAILRQEIKPEEALPSIRGLAKDLQISVITTKRAYEELEAQGLIYSVPGRGFFVCNRKLEMLKEKKIQDLEKRMSELIRDCKEAELSKEDIRDMLELLYEEA